MAARRDQLRWAVVCALAFLATAAYAKTVAPDFDGIQTAAEASWDYSDPDEKWGTNFPQCTQGKSQSPVDIVLGKPASRTLLGTPASPSRPAFRLIEMGTSEQSDLTIINNGHALQMNAHDNTLALGGKTYTLRQMHFHSPSENTVNGRQHDMEMQMVHCVTSSCDDMAVIGIFFDTNVTTASLPNRHARHVMKFLAAAFNPNTPKSSNASEATGHVVEQRNLRRLLGSVGQDPDKTQSATIGIDAKHATHPLQAAGNNFYSFVGSLTTPPCTEGVEWLVAEKVLPLPKMRLKYFRNALLRGMGLTEETASTKTARNGNARPTQPLNQRVVRRLSYEFAKVFMVQDSAPKPSNLPGVYTDPNHPTGLRMVSVEGRHVVVHGKDKTDDPLWTVEGTTDGERLTLDFSPKGGPKDLAGAWEANGIVWADGNKWTKISPGSLPKNSEARAQAGVDPKMQDKELPAVDARLLPLSDSEGENDWKE